MTRWATTADLNRCVGCQTCTAACKHANATAPGIQWRKVLDIETGEFPDVRRSFMPVGCMHCDDAPCLDVCPTLATKKRDDGIVTIDYDLCIGCAYCIMACPYQARSKTTETSAAFGKGKVMRHETLREDPERINVAQKCTFCVDRIDSGLAAGLTPGLDADATPSCVNACIAGALAFGDIEDQDSNVSQLLAENSHFRMHEDLNTGPGIYYLWDKADGNTDQSEPEMIPDPVGAAAISPKLQNSWDWRASANFILGGAGSGLFTASAIAALFGLNVMWPMLAAMTLIGLGLFCVWLEIGRPWRFLNVYRNAKTSWMTREAMVVMPLFAVGLATVLTKSLILGVVGAVFALGFLYCQAQILKASKGIPAWRQPEIITLILSTGLTEGVSVLLLYSAVFGGDLPVIGIALLVLIAARHLAWRSYRRALGAASAPSNTFAALDGATTNLGLPYQATLLGLLVIGLLSNDLQPVFLSLAAFLALLSGGWFKYTLITRAAFNQGYATNHIPRRGAGNSARGIKPGWTKS